METAFYVSLFLTYSVFILPGFQFAKKIKRPISTSSFILIIIATFIVGWFKVARIVDVFNFIVQVNWCLQGFGIGVIIGLLRSRAKTKVITN